MASLISSITNRIVRRFSDSSVINNRHYNIDGPPRCSDRRRKSVAAESFDPEESAEEGAREAPVVYPKSDEQRHRLINAVKEILLFRCLDEEQKGEVIDAMQEMRVEPGQLIIKQGDNGDNFYVIESGKFDVYKRNDDQSPDILGAKVSSYDGQGSFGELALMYNTTRFASIKANSPGIVWSLDRTTFRRIVLRAAFLKRQKYECLLEEVSLLNGLEQYERKRLADALQSRQYEDNVLIIAQGDVGTEMYFIESGTVRIVYKEQSKEVEVKKLGKGEYFGELALITNKPRAASVYAVGTTKLAVLDVASFERLMGPCIEVMKRNIDTYDKQLQELIGSDSLKPEQSEG